MVSAIVVGFLVGAVLGSVGVLLFRALSGRTVRPSRSDSDIWEAYQAELIRRRQRRAEWN